jgi:hypothetical protein
MAEARSSDLLGQVRGLMNTGGVVAGPSDRDLLASFAAKRASAERDRVAAEAAFGAIVARHGPMVLGVCRRALENERSWSRTRWGAGFMEWRGGWR